MIATTKVLLLLATVLSLAFCWDTPVRVLPTSFKSITEVGSLYMDPETMITHAIVVTSRGTMYMQISRANELLLKRSIAPPEDYILGTACLTAYGEKVTILASLVNFQTHMADVWFMDSVDGGNSWTAYRKIPVPESPYRFDRTLSCPIANVKGRITVVYGVNNMTSDTRPLILGVATRAPGADDFSQERLIGVWPQYRNTYFVAAAYTQRNGQALLHVITDGNNKLLYLQSANNGTTWTAPVTVATASGIVMSATKLVARGAASGDLYLSYEKSPTTLALLVSHDHGKSWTRAYTLLEDRYYGPYTLTMCRKGGKDVLTQYVPCKHGGHCLFMFEITDRAFTKHMYIGPYEDGHSAALACAEAKETRKEWMVALSSLQYDDYFYFYVTHNSSATAVEA